MNGLPLVVGGIVGLLFGTSLQVWLLAAASFVSGMVWIAVSRLKEPTPEQTQREEDENRARIEQAARDLEKFKEFITLLPKRTVGGVGRIGRWFARHWIATGVAVLAISALAYCNSETTNREAKQEAARSALRAQAQAECPDWQKALCHEVTWGCSSAEDPKRCFSERVSACGRFPDLTACYARERECRTSIVFTDCMSKGLPRSPEEVVKEERDKLIPGLRDFEEQRRRNMEIVNSVKQ